jgi:hypothetical protein
MWGVASGATVTDDLNRSNSSPIGGNWNTVHGNTAVNLYNNKAAASGYQSAMFYNAFVPTNDQVAQIEYVAGYSVGIWLRVDTGSYQTGYVLRGVTESNRLAIEKYLNGYKIWMTYL